MLFEKSTSPDPTAKTFMSISLKLESGIERYGIKNFKKTKTEEPQSVSFAKLFFLQSPLSQLALTALPKGEPIKTKQRLK